MARGGARSGAGRRKLVPEKTPDKRQAGIIIESLGKPSPHPKKCRCWKCLWKRDAERLDAQGQATRRYLWDRWEGKAVHTVNHLHDKPIEHNVTFSIADKLREARERASKR